MVVTIRPEFLPLYPSPPHFVKSGVKPEHSCLKNDAVSMQGVLSSQDLKLSEDHSVEMVALRDCKKKSHDDLT